MRDEYSGLANTTSLANGEDATHAGTRRMGTGITATITNNRNYVSGSSSGGWFSHKIPVVTRGTIGLTAFHATNTAASNQHSVYGFVRTSTANTGTAGIAVNQESSGDGQTISWWNETAEHDIYSVTSGASQEWEYALATDGESWIYIWARPSSETDYLFLGRYAYDFLRIFQNGIGWTYDGACAAYVKYNRIPTERWLPVPIHSDGFGTTFGNSDGAGHGADTTDIDAGGAGGAYTIIAGSWSTSGGSLSGSWTSGAPELIRADKTADYVDAILSCEVTLSSGEAGIALRNYSVIPNNFIKVAVTTSGVELFESESGVDTSISTIGGTYTAGGFLQVRLIGQTCTVFYEGELITEVTLDSAYNTGQHGLFNESTNATIDNFVIYDTTHEKLKEWGGNAPS